MGNLIFRPHFSEPKTGLDFEIIDPFPEKPVVLYCHGNTTTIKSNRKIKQICQKYGLNLCHFDYSGYGYSSGSPSCQQILRDGEEMIEKLSGYPEIIIWGRSLGTGVATYLAIKYECRAIILTAPYINLPGVLFGIWPGICLNWLADSVLGDSLANYKRITKLKCKIVYIHGIDDQVIPIKHSQYLMGLTQTEYKSFFVDGNHRDLQDDGIYEEIFTWI